MLRMVVPILLGGGITALAEGHLSWMGQVLGDELLTPDPTFPDYGPGPEDLGWNSNFPEITTTTNPDGSITTTTVYPNGDTIINTRIILLFLLNGRLGKRMKHRFR